MKLLKIASLAVVSLLLLAGCESKTAPQLRAEHLQNSQEDVVLAVAWPLKSVKGTLVDGAKLALDEINAKGGVLGGKKLKLLLKDDESSLTRGRLVAQEIANDPQVSAVIGHLNTYVAHPASQIYERAGIVMLTPGASGQKITESDNRMVFRGLPGNRDQGRQMGDYAAAQGYKNIAIYYIKNDYGVDLANYFEQRANELGINIIDRRSYNKEGDSHAAIFADWVSFLKYDAIFLAGSLPEGAQILRDIRQSGIRQPVFAGVGLDSPELLRLGGSAIENTVVFSLYNPNRVENQVQAFNQAFQKRYGRSPDSTAAQGYDSVNLLAYAISTAKSRDPQKIAQVLRTTRGWAGVTGDHSFSEKGDLIAKRLAKSTVKNGQFVFENEAMPAAR